MERVSARDGDTGVNDDVFYTLEDAGNYLINGQPSFIIYAETGEISVNVTSLDRETHSSYSLTVTVGGPFLTPDCVHLITITAQATEVTDTSKVTTATVFITVLDNNDNIPTFDQANYTVNVSELEDFEQGRTLLQVTATDRDTVHACLTTAYCVYDTHSCPCRDLMPSSHTDWRTCGTAPQLCPSPSPQTVT